jgi:SSS family solute:Na+ symporter
MNVSFPDWLILAVVLASLAWIAAATRRCTRSVSDFLAGNRAAGRYLLTMSEGISGVGLVGVVANFEKFYHAGFAASWWGNLLAPVSLLIALSGWVVYRYRQTRALTMAQFFEMRYSRGFRVFAGVLAWVSGVLNYGIFPGVIARFLIYFTGLPAHFAVAGITVPTLPVVMACMLGLAVAFTVGGGMVTVMITDFCQAQFINIAFLAVLACLFFTFSWSDIIGTLRAAPAHQSLINPFDQAGISDFDIWFFAILAFKAFYNCLGWQGTQGYNASAKSPHEARMARILAEWRGGVSYLMIMLIPIGAYVLLHAPQCAAQAGDVHAALAAIPDAQDREQMTVPVALSRMLPPGVLGLFLAAMVAAALGNDTTYLHSWGSIFIQDVVLPFRRKPLTVEQHLRLLRLSIVGVALFAFVFSLVFPLRDYIYMYFLITGAIYLGGSGAVIIGGLYWRKGTTAGAWAALATGGVLAAGGMILRAAWPSVPALRAIAPAFPLNGSWTALAASLCAIVVYVVVSLATCRADFDLDRMLHRAVPPEAPATAAARRGWRRFLGIGDEFTRGDRWIYYAKIAWSGFWFATFGVGTTAALLWGIPDRMWAGWWLFTIVLTAFAGAITIVWFLWGGVRDLRQMLKTLRDEQIDVRDDGTVAPASSRE